MVRAFDAPVMLTTRTASQVASLLQGHTAKMHAGDPKRVESAIELCAPPATSPDQAIITVSQTADTALSASSSVSRYEPRIDFDKLLA